MDRSDSPGHVTVGALLASGNEVLLCHRSAERTWFPDVWDLPGGHIEPGESPTTALVRELQEELGISARRPADDCHFRVCTDDFDLQVWLITEWVGEPTNVSPEEHDAIGWFSESQAVQLDLAHASYPSLISEAFDRLRSSV